MHPFVPRLNRSEVLFACKKDLSVVLFRLMRWLDRIAAKYVPRVPAIAGVLERAGAVIREARVNRQTEQEIESALGTELQLQKRAMNLRAREYQELRTADAACRVPDRELKELGVSLPIQFQAKERMWELELALEDRGWVRETTLAMLEFSRYGVQQLIRICRIYAIKNPLIQRGVSICALYVLGRGIEIRSDDDQANGVIQDFLDQNKTELGHVGLAEKIRTLQTDGSLYFALPTDPKGNVAVEMIDALEVLDIITDPDDTSKPWYYHRQWNRETFDPASGVRGYQPKKCWYPALELVEDPPQTRATSIAGVPVNWDTPIQRVKVGCPAKWRWGVPPLYAAIDWARAYKDFLEDWATVQRTLSRFALMIETKGGPGAIAAYNALLNTTFADNDGTQIEKNPPPVVGSAHIGGPGTSINAFKSANVQTSPEQARRILLMFCAATGLPETFLGDASTGSLATAVSLDRPTELKFTEMQRLLADVIKRQLVYVLQVSKTTPGGRMREAVTTKKAPRILVKFPTVVEHDIQPMIQAITEIASMGGRTGIAAGLVDRRTICDLLLAEIGYEDRGVLLDKIYGKNYDPAADVTDQRSQVPPQLLAQPTGKPMTDLSTPPPLPPQPAPPPPVAPPPPAPGEGVPAVPAKPGAPLAKNAKPPAKGALTKEGLAGAIADLREALANMVSHNGR